MNTLVSASSAMGGFASGLVLGSAANIGGYWATTIPTFFCCCCCCGFGPSSSLGMIMGGHFLISFFGESSFSTGVKVAAYVTTFFWNAMGPFHFSKKFLDSGKAGKPIAVSLIVGPLAGILGCYAFGPISGLYIGGMTSTAVSYIGLGINGEFIFGEDLGKEIAGGIGEKIGEAMSNAILQGPNRR